MNPLEFLKTSIISDFNELATEVQKDLNNPRPNLEKIELEYPPLIKEFIETHNQKSIKKQTNEYKKYLKIFEEKKNNIEFKQFEGFEFENLIKHNREFKKLLDSL